MPKGRTGATAGRLAWPKCDIITNPIRYLIEVSRATSNAFAYWAICYGFRSSSPFYHSFFPYNFDSILYQFDFHNTESGSSPKTSLAIAYSVFLELSTAHRDNRPIQELYKIMRTIGTSSPPWRRSYVIHILPVAAPRSSGRPEISNVYFSSSCTFT
jgi:hypothetical protein